MNQERWHEGNSLSHCRGIREARKARLTQILNKPIGNASASVPGVNCTQGTSGDGWRSRVFRSHLKQCVAKLCTAKQMPSVLWLSAQDSEVIANSSEMTLQSRCPAWTVAERVENTMNLIIVPAKRCSWESVSAWLDFPSRSWGLSPWKGARQEAGRTSSLTFWGPWKNWFR